MGYYTILMISHDEIAMSLKPSLVYSDITEIISDSVKAGHTEKHVGGVKVRTIHCNDKDFKNILKMFKNEAGKVVWNEKCYFWNESKNRFMEAGI